MSKTDSIQIPKSSESIEKVYRISAKLSSSLDLDKILQVLSESLLDLTGFDICNIFLPDPDNGEYLLNVFASDKEQYFAKERVFLKNTNHLKEVFESKKIMFYCGLERNKIKPRLLKYFRKYDITCSVHIPIAFPRKKQLGKSDIKGCIILDKRKSACNIYSKELNKNILMITNLAAIAINNFLLHETFKNQRNRWYAIFEDTTDGIVIVDNELKINNANRAFKKMVDLEAKEAIGKDVGKLFENDNQYDVILKNLKDGFEGETIPSIKREVILKTKLDTLPASLRISFIKSTENYPRAILSFEDISKEKELEHNKDDFVSIVSHELRTPITVTRGYLSLLERKEFGELNDKQARFLTKTINSADKVASLLEGILEANRLSLGKIKLKLEPVNLVNIVKTVILDLNSLFKERNIKVDMKEKKIPKVCADEIRLYQIIYNILDNARKYSSKNSRINIGFQVKGNRVLLTVEDHGVGMSFLEKRNIFRRFTRTENALSNEAGGFGLGLYIVKSLVVSHKGKIWVESEKDKGTKVNVLLNQYE